MVERWRWFILSAEEERKPGCERCRMDLIRFNQTVKLPRFTMHEGEEWHVPQVRYLADGSILIGHGVAPAHTFEIVKRDDKRAIHNSLSSRERCESGEPWDPNCP